MNNALLSSRYSKWETPTDIVSQLSQVYDWDIDLCASRPNVCEQFWSEEQNSLEQDWLGRGPCWMNPPYGRGIRAWMDKARHAAINSDFSCVSLVPSRTGSAWWQDNMWAATMIVYVRGRLTFGSDEYWKYLWTTPEIDGEENPLYGKDGTRYAAPFDSAFILWGKHTAQQKEVIQRYGRYEIPVRDPPAYLQFALL